MARVSIYEYICIYMCIYKHTNITKDLRNYFLSKL